MKRTRRPVDSDSVPPPPPGAARKAKGMVQMVAGGALAVAGVPLCVLPGPGVAAIVGGVALASRGQRAFSGRAPSRIEQKLDHVAARAAATARQEAAKAARAVAREAPVVAGKAARAAARGVEAARERRERKRKG